jgi:hypothetical protein
LFVHTSAGCELLAKLLNLVLQRRERGIFFVVYRSEDSNKENPSSEINNNWDILWLL